MVTIDPAKRLADALGLERCPTRRARSIASGGTTTTPSARGELWALMLDTKSTFDDLVTRYAATPSRRERILDNRFYRNVSGALAARRSTWRWRSSTSCTTTGDFDLIVVDTPPTRHALDFLDAPRRLTASARQPHLPDADDADARRT